VQTELDLRAASEDEARARLTRQRDGVRERETALLQMSESHRALTGEQTILDRELADLTEQRSETERRLSAAQQAYTSAEAGLRDARGTLEQCESEDRTAQNALEQARHALTAAREQEAALVVQRRSTDDHLTQLQARAEALRALETERAGLAPAARQLLSARERFESGTVMGPLSDFIRTDAGNARATERVLAEWLHAVVIRDEQVLESIRAWHRDTQPGPLLLLPLSPGPRNGTPGTPPPFGVDVEHRLEAWATALLANNSTEDDDATMIRRANGAVFLPGLEEASGPLSRRAELTSLERQTQGVNAELQRLISELNDATASHEACESSLARAIEQADFKATALREARGALDDATRAYQRCGRDLTEAQETKSRLDARIGERTQRRQDVVNELHEIERSRAEVEERLDAERHQLAAAEAEQETAREKRVHWQVEEAQVSARESAAQERQERATATLREAESTIERLTRELGEIENSTSSRVNERSAWSDRLGERRAELTRLERASMEAEARVSHAQTQLQACEEALEKCRLTVQQVGEDLHKLELEASDLFGRRRALTERLEAEWHKPIGELLNAAEPIDGEEEDLTAEAERLATAIEAIGPVNPLAAREYEEEKNRLEFLQSQREDLAEARSSLAAALKEIDQTARRLFQETFEEIRQNFHRVFLTLFEGGDCDVRLSDPTDSLASEIEIRAAPRGKRTQRIHLLSSGERALVAISLLFAIYLAKPSPFCLLDEVDAPLDDANVQRFIRLITEFKDDTQFIVITHNPRTMQVSDNVYGVTMQEPGVSTIVGVRLGQRQTA
jgi:chromosome segregation protein